MSTVTEFVGCTHTHTMTHPDIADVAAELRGVTTCTYCGEVVEPERVRECKTASKPPVAANEIHSPEEVLEHLWHPGQHSLCVAQRGVDRFLDSMHDTSASLLKRAARVRTKGCVYFGIHAVTGAKLRGHRQVHAGRPRASSTP